jgi:hypothetical protein
MRCFLAAARLGILVCAACGPCNAQWTKTIACAPGRVYRDNRNDTGGQLGGQEFCEHVLPGSLRVKDGPFRFWLSRNFQGAAGDFDEGREIGTWKECDRSGRCEQKAHTAVNADERERPGSRPEIPVSYADGKYIFDFASCRTTWITQTDGEKPILELYVGANTAVGCQIAYIPWFITGSTAVDYLCTIPFTVGTRAMNSLDLRSELPKLGLPQFCGNTGSSITVPDLVSVESFSGGGMTQVFTVRFPIAKAGPDIAQAKLDFEATPTSRANRCVVRYDPGTENVYLLDDQGGKYLGPIAASGDDSLWNNRCLVAGCSREVSGDVLTVQFGIRFNAIDFAGTHHMFLETVDDQGHASTPLNAGGWIVPAIRRGAPAPAWPTERICPSAVPPP